MHMPEDQSGSSSKFRAMSLSADVATGKSGNADPLTLSIAVPSFHFLVLAPDEILVRGTCLSINKPHLRWMRKSCQPSGRQARRAPHGWPDAARPPGPRQRRRLRRARQTRRPRTAPRAAAGRCRGKPAGNAAGSQIPASAAPTAEIRCSHLAGQKCQFSDMRFSSPWD